MQESSHAHEMLEIVDHVRDYLKHKRYFVLVDDLWDQRAWDIISCAFPENSTVSRVVVTTRIDEVALWACHNDRDKIYRMKQLEELDSRRLFFNRVFGSENVCPPHFTEISAQILKKCGGLPLAIITIASLLASLETRSLNEWESIKNSLGAKFATKPTLEDMRGILNLSYIHLPVHLRPCLLYLGMYPEDHEIERNDLVRQWIAEGLVCSSHGVDLEDVANSYFNELINKSLIQPGRTKYGEVLSCRVHDMLLDLILSKSTYGNFASVAHNYEDMARLHNCEHKLHRLSLQSSAGGATSETLPTSMSQVRSYAGFGESMCTHLSQFKYLRVLLFEFPYRWDTAIDLAAIGHLFLLRYVKVLAYSAEVVLPTKIQRLRHLQTLDLVCNPVQSFPSEDITRLANLFHLRFPHGTALPTGIQSMKSIRTLHCSGMLESSPEDIKGLSGLTNLKELYVSTPDDGQSLTVEQVDALVSSVGLLGHLKLLRVECEIESAGSEGRLDSLHAPSLGLEDLDLEGWQFSRVPKWVGELRCLRILGLLVLHMSSDDVRVLGELPHSSTPSSACRMCPRWTSSWSLGTGSFPVLEHIWLESHGDVTACLRFEAGAMPKLQKLVLEFGWKEWSGATPAGMECLPCLQEIHAYIGDSGTGGADVRADMESAFKAAASVHPRHPSVKVAYC